MSHPQLDTRSVELRRSIFNTLRAGRRGHVGSALSLVEILRVLYDDVLRYDPKRPDWPERDRFWEICERFGESVGYIFYAMQKTS